MSTYLIFFRYCGYTMNDNLSPPDKPLHQITPPPPPSTKKAYERDKPRGLYAGFYGIITGFYIR